jgi:outer membrane protein OmpA-like peptidoglycan-associated protein
MQPPHPTLPCALVAGHLMDRLTGWLGRCAGPVFAAALALLVAGCSTTSPPPAGARSSAPKPGAQSAPAGSPKAPVSLDVERQWLQDWFKGTPVVIAQAANGDLDIAVPRAYCFDAGRSVIKPALGAVLDKVAESLRRQGDARLVLIAAPGDAAAAPALASERAARVRLHVRNRGVPESRLGPPARADGAAVQLRMRLPQP